MIKRLFLVFMLALALPKASFAQFFVSVFPAFQIGSENFKEEDLNRQFYLNYLNDPHLFDLGIDFSTANIDVYLRLDLLKSIKGASNNAGFSNFFISKGEGFSTAGFNSEFPTLGYLGYHNSWIDVSAGRRRLGAGPGKYSLMLGSQNPSLDGIWIFLDPLRDDYLVRPYGIIMGAASNARANKTFLKYNQRYWDETNKKWITKDEIPAGETLESRYRNNNKYYFFHKLGIATDFLRVGISESFTAYGEDTSFWLYNPYVLWHNSYVGNANAALSITAEGKIGDSIRVYGEWMMDDLVIGEFDIDKPSAMGASLGVEWQIKKAKSPFIADEYGDESQAKKEPTFAHEDGLIVGLEAVWTSRYLYQRGPNDPFGALTFFTSHQYGQQDEKEDWPLFEYYLGFPYGGESSLVEARVVYKENRWNVKGSLGYLIEGDRKDRGVYGVGNSFLAQDLIPTSEKDRKNWLGYRGNIHHSLLLNARAYFAITRSFQAYASLQTQLRMDNFSESTARMGLGVAYKVRTEWFGNKKKKQPATVSTDATASEATQEAENSMREAERRMREAEESMREAERRMREAEAQLRATESRNSSAN